MLLVITRQTADEIIYSNKQIEIKKKFNKSILVKKFMHNIIKQKFLNEKK